MENKKKLNLSKGDIAYRFICNVSYKFDMLSLPMIESGLVVSSEEDKWNIAFKSKLVTVSTRSCFYEYLFDSEVSAMEFANNEFIDSLWRYIEKEWIGAPSRYTESEIIEAIFLLNFVKLAVDELYMAAKIQWNVPSEMDNELRAFCYHILRQGKDFYHNILKDLTIAKQMFDGKLYTNDIMSGFMQIELSLSDWIYAVDLKCVSDYYIGKFSADNLAMLDRVIYDYYEAECNKRNTAKNFFSKLKFWK